MGGMAEKGNSAASEAGMAVLAAVRQLRGDLIAVQEAQQAGDDPTGLALVLGAMGRPMQRGWSLPSNIRRLRYWEQWFRCSAR